MPRSCCAQGNGESGVGRFRHAYAILEDCPPVWLDKKGRYKGPSKPSEWITYNTELFLGLIDHHGKPGKSIEQAGEDLRETLGTAEQNVRTFLAIKAVLDAAADAVEMDVPGNTGVLAGAWTRLDAFIQLYNLRLEELKEKRRPWESGETRLEKALKMLPAIEVNKPKPSLDSLMNLKEKILNDARGEEWLRVKADVNLNSLIGTASDDEKTDRVAWDHGPCLPVFVELRDLAVKGLPAKGEPTLAISSMPCKLSHYPIIFSIFFC